MEALKSALRAGRPIAVWHDPPQLRYLIEGPAGTEEFRVAAERTFPCLAREFPALAWFERELVEEDSLTRVGCAAPKPLRDHSVPYPFTTFEDLHEVPVGPVHAGVIEPGHFHFSVLGERIVNLEIRLGYQHRGVSALFAGASLERARLLAERVGSEPVAHALCFARAVERIAGVEVPPHAELLRLVLLELERIFQHLGHLAGLFADVGYGFGATQTGRVRALVQAQIERLTGHRYGRNAVLVGGVAARVEPDTALAVRAALAALATETEHLIAPALRHPMVLDRLRYVGVVSEGQAHTLGLVGPTARASGVGRDLRSYEATYEPFTPVTRKGGDVLARAHLYLIEAQHSFGYLDRFLSELPVGPAGAPTTVPDGEAWARVESARGELVYWLRVEDRRVRDVEIVGPSFKNWPALEVAVRGAGLPDFPVCNKSFDLSYADCDL